MKKVPKITFWQSINKHCQMLHFYIPLQREEIFGFLTNSGGIEMQHYTKMG